MLFSAFILGLTSSLHCVGMCGPIALALPGRKQVGLSFVPGRVAYQAGRVVTYMMLGIALGLFGEGLSLVGYQSGLSLVLGILLILVALVTLIGKKQNLEIPVLSTLLTRLKRSMAPLLSKGAPHSLFQLGILNGFLPCGFVYLALAGALATGDVWESMTYMGLFGLGTWPAMLLISLAGAMLSPRLRSMARPLMLGITLVLGCLLILRGMNLGIPFISPMIIPVETGATIVECH